MIVLKWILIGILGFSFLFNIKEAIAKEILRERIVYFIASIILGITIFYIFMN